MRRALLLSLLLLSSLTGCDWLATHRIDIQQGNFFKPKTLARLHRGMTKGEVANVMGSPVYENTFNANRWVYVFSRQKKKEVYVKKVIVVFRDGRVARIIKDIPPPPEFVKHLGRHKKA